MAGLYARQAQVPEQPKINYYGEDVNFAAAVIVTVVFGWIMLGTAGHLVYRAVTSEIGRRSARFGSFLVIAPFVETFGFAFRVASVADMTNRTYFVISLITLVVAPQASAAACYIIFPALLLATDASLCVLPGQHIAAIWLGFDFICGALQGGGAGRFAKGPASFMSGVIICFIGLAIQWATFSVFTVFVWIYYWRVRGTRFYVRAIRLPLLGILISSTAHMVRFTYRLVEFGLLFRAESLIQAEPVPEICLYLLDALPMIIANGVIAICLPWEVEPQHIHGPFYFALNYLRKKVRKVGKNLKDDRNKHGEGQRR